MSFLHNPYTLKATLSHINSNKTFRDRIVEILRTESHKAIQNINIRNAKVGPTKNSQSTFVSRASDHRMQTIETVSDSETFPPPYTSEPEHYLTKFIRTEEGMCSKMAIPGINLGSRLTFHLRR
jgi:hypothetical protein